MEKTTHYELNQWAGEDRILRLDFNADNEKLDAALYQLSQTQTAHAAALEAEAQTRSAQDTAVRQEFAAGDTAVAGQIALVKLGHIVTQQAAAQVDLDLSGYGPQNYAALYIIPSLPNVATVYVRVNNISSESYTNSRDYLAKCYGFTAGSYCTLRLFLTNRLICATEDEVTYVLSSVAPPSGPITLNFFSYSSDTLSAGSEFFIYGVRK